MSQSQPAQTIIFVKEPKPGTVKTRLAASIGPHAAAKAYETMVKDLLSSLATIPLIDLRYAPAGAGGTIRRWLQDGWTLTPQSEGNLGDRLIDAFEDSKQLGNPKTIIIGSDCPCVSPDDIRLAAAGLDEHDLVIGPATDGGYWLIALREPQPLLFQNIAWSTGQVFSQTLERAKQEGLNWLELRKLSDIDTMEDWQLYLESHRSISGNQESPQL
jgi:rSAM/selenodomain-associated transferase 1